MQDLPPKIIQDFLCDLSPLQSQLYSGLLASSSQAIDSASNIKNHGGVFKTIQSLRKLVVHPSLVTHNVHVIHGDETRCDDPHYIFQSGKLKALYSLLLECGLGGDRKDAGNPSMEADCRHRVLIFAQLRGECSLE